jgi:hypothetical protein
MLMALGDLNLLRRRQEVVDLAGDVDYHLDRGPGPQLLD